MNAWFAGDLVAALLLLPALAATMARLLLTLRAIGRDLDAIIDDNADVLARLHAVPRLAETEMLTGAGLPGVIRYTAALEQAL